MTSPRPLLYNTCYHIYNRGVNRGNIFFEERNYAYFLKLYEKHIAPVADTFAYCLLKNHFHLVVRVKAQEIKTLKVSSPNVYQAGQGLTANREPDKPEKQPATVRELGATNNFPYVVARAFFPGTERQDGVPEAISQRAAKLDKRAFSSARRLLTCTAPNAVRCKCRREVRPPRNDIIGSILPMKSSWLTIPHS